MRRVKKTNNCWEWLGKRDEHGYGCSRVIKLSWHAHRASYYLFKEDIPKGMIICHNCDNPGCVNPDHLFVGTQKENIQDMIKKGRKPIGDDHPSRKNPSYLKRGSMHWKSRVKESDILNIRREHNGEYGIGVKIAKKYNISPQMVSNIVNKKGWNHV